LIAAGAVIYFAAPSKPSSVSLAPALGPGFAGLSLRGRL
jgi:hypothetical protein